MGDRTLAYQSTDPLRRIALAVTTAFALATLASCAAPTESTGALDSLESASINSDEVSAACATLLENYTASLKSSSTGRDHPGSYTVQAATSGDLAALLPPGALDGTRVDCVIWAHSSVVEPTQITGVILSPSVDDVTAVRDALTAAGWEPDVIETGVSFRGPEPEMPGAQTYVLDAATAEQIGVPTGAFAVIAGQWDLWGAF